MILANLIKSIKDSFCIEIKEINISVTKISESINSQTPYIYIDNNFDTNSNRNNFLLNAIENLTGILPNTKVCVCRKRLISFGQYSDTVYFRFLLDSIDAEVDL